jgi:putative SOS response-associated peptidase YedK
MCVNFTPAQLDRLLRMAGMPSEVRDLDYPKETWPMYRAPMVRTVADLEALKDPTLATVDGVKFRVDAAHFGLIPYWAKADEVLKHRSTHNARSETLHEKPTYKAAWARCQFALIPMANFREPYYGPERKNKKSVQWEIQRKDRELFTVAAIWSEWKSHQTGEVLLSFSCITDGDEPRSLVIIPPEHREAWVTETDPDKARRFFVGFDVDGFEAGPVQK